MGGWKEGHGGVVVGIWGAGGFLFTGDAGGGVKQWRVRDQRMVKGYAGGGAGMVV